MRDEVNLDFWSGMIVRIKIPKNHYWITLQIIQGLFFLDFDDSNRGAVIYQMILSLNPKSEGLTTIFTLVFVFEFKVEAKMPISIDQILKYWKIHLLAGCDFKTPNFLPLGNLPFLPMLNHWRHIQIHRPLFIHGS